MKHSTVQVVVGGQYGSEAKGAVAAHLSRTLFKQNAAQTVRHVACRVAGPNAGHTVISDDGVEFKLQQLPVAAVTSPQAVLAIAAGSEIDPDTLAAEVALLEYHEIPVRRRLWIDPQATVIKPEHQVTEHGHHAVHGESGITASIGSTGKGVGAARADRLWRKPRMTVDENPIGRDGEYNIGDTADLMQTALGYGANVQIEGTQGYGLGLHAGYYPYCTSSDCRAIDFLAMAGISPWQFGAKLDVWVVFRTFPIRVAGNSGPLLGELTWDEMSAWLGKPVQEFTTVTKKPRRIGQWDNDLACRAMAANGGPSLDVHAALTFLDYWAPTLENVEGDELLAKLTHPSFDVLAHRLAMAEAAIGQPFDLFGTGPASYTYRRNHA